MSIDKLKAWIQASRAPFFVATLIPLALGGVVARSEGHWDAAMWIVLFVACFLVQLCTNLANDYFDCATGADAGDSIGGSRVVQEGKISLHEIRTALVILYAVAFVLGLWIIWVSELWWIAGLMAFAFFSSLSYTGPPMRYGYFGLGELFVGLNMGPVMVVGTASALAGHYVPRALWLSVPIALMAAMILYYQSLPDIDTDRAVGKRTIAVRLGKPTAIWGFRFFAASSLAAIALLVCLGLLHSAALMSLGTLILACMVDRMIRRTSDWKDLHDRGAKVRMFYLTNGLILALTVGCFR